MILLDEILKNAGPVEFHGNATRLEGKICFDSRKVEKGDLFIALPGTKSDGHQYISSVVEAGAAIVVCEKLPGKMESGVSYIKVRDSHECLGLMSAAYYGHPSLSMKVVGVTGTNGKTTIASLLFETSRKLGYKSGLISTIKVSVNGIEKPATHTTPDPVQIQSVLAEMKETGCDYVFMEVSSHAVDQKRIAGIHFTGAVFTNLSLDHLDYHKDFSSYRDAKKKFFDHLDKQAFALTNKDDRNGMVMVQNTQARIFSYALKSDADFKAKVLEMHMEGNLLELNKNEIWTRLPGSFNASNMLAVFGAAVLLGFGKEEVLKILSELRSVDGRFEIIRAADGPVAVVDYAHTPDALDNVLRTIKDIRKAEKIITVVGAGGDRDRSKRPEMAKIAASLSDRLILTSDNPRSEDPEMIIAEMKEGLDPLLQKKVMSISNREEAIRTACLMAGPGDVILIAGKGHETYQEIKGVKYHFDDREKVREFLNI